jgi:hypothetical protein
MLLTRLKTTNIKGHMQTIVSKPMGGQTKETRKFTTNLSKKKNGMNNINLLPTTAMT